MTRAAAAATFLLAACAAHGPSVLTVVPVRATSATSPVAVELRYDDLGCGVFAKDGPAPNARAGRDCLERSLPKTPCEGGGSPELATLELAVSLIDGAGGPADVPRARKLLDGCFADVAREAVLEHAAAKQKNEATAPLEKCDAYAQTTLAMTECTIEHTQTERAWLRRIEHELAPDLRTLFASATLAFERYAEKIGAIEYERYAGGTMRSPAMAAKILALLQRRRARVATLRAFVPAHVTSDELRSTREQIERTSSTARDAEPEAPAAVDDAIKAWIPYFEAELALYERVSPNSRDSVTVLLGQEHAADLCASVPP